MGRRLRGGPVRIPEHDPPPMATDTQDSSLDFFSTPTGEVPPPGQWPWNPPSAVSRDKWLDGGVQACACPDCGSPMSIRLWLRLADCWACGTSLELSEEVVRELERQQRTRPVPTVAPIGRPGPKPSEPEKKRSPEPAPETKQVPTPPPPPDIKTRVARTTSPDKKRVAAASQPNRAQRRIREMATVGRATVWWREMFRDMTAWLASLLLHLILLLLLANYILSGLEREPPHIVLSTKIDEPRREGGETQALPTDEVTFDLPIDPNDLPETKDARLKLQQDARELRLDPDLPIPNAAPLHIVKEAIRSKDPSRRALALRDPRVRAEVVRKEGGTTATEAAVARGLRWMAQHQNTNGSWSLHAFNKTPQCKGRCNGHGGLVSDPGGTALVLLPFLGAGQTHLVGNYREEVGAGLAYLLSIQKPDGDLRGNSAGHSGMYAHGQAALVLSEAYKLTGDEKLREPAQKAIDFVVAAQHKAGGWRYQPGQPADTSVTGWGVMALYSAKSAYLDVPDTALPLAALYLDRCQKGVSGGLYGYQPGGGPTETMTAEALLCRMMMGWNRENPGLQEGVSFLLDNHMPDLSQKNAYYWYYGTQMMHHIGDKPWHRWNVKMRSILVQTQEKEGHQAGSWPNDTKYGGQGGRIYTTALNTASLEVYYRHAPLFRQINLD